MALYETTLAGAIGHWPLGDNTASTTIVALKGANATLVGGNDTSDLYDVDAPPGYASSLDLDGSNDYVQTSLAVEDLPSTCAVLVWFKSVPQIDQTVLGNQLMGNSSASFFFEVGHSNSPFRGAVGTKLANNSFPTPGGPYTIDTTEWGLHGIVIDSGTLHTVIDGTRQSHGIDISGDTADPTQPIRFGIATSRPALGKIAGALVVPSASQSTLTAIKAGPLPAHTGGTVTLSDNLETVTDTTTFAASAPNGAVVKALSYQHEIASQWEETDTNTFADKIEGRRYRVVVSASNNGGNDPAEDQVSNVVTYTAASGRRRPHSLSGRTSALAPRTRALA